MLPPTPSSGRASPSISEGSVSEEEQLNDKPSNPDESAEDVKKGTGPRTQLFKPQTKFIQNYQKNFEVFTYELKNIFTRFRS